MPNGYEGKVMVTILNKTEIRMQMTTRTRTNRRKAKGVRRFPNKRIDK